MIYLFAEKWRGAIHASNLRYFADYESLKAHVATQTPEKWSGGEPWHAYEVYDDGRPARVLTLKENRALGLRPPKETK